MTQHLLRPAVALLSLALLAAPVQATERTQLRALLGLPGQDLTTPLLPGWYGQINVQHYDADKVLGNDGKVPVSAVPGLPSAQVRQDATVRARVVAARLTWLSEMRVGEEGRFGVSATLPYVDTRISANAQVQGSIPAALAGGLGAQLAAASAAASGQQAAQGDMEIAPFVDWQDDSTRMTAALAVVAPTGDYDAKRAVNPGAGNFWTLRPVLNLALVTENGWELGLRNTYSFNSRNDDTGYRSGQYLHSDGSALYSVRDGLRVGLGAYLVVQTTRDDGATAPAHGNKARVFALGPVLSWQNDSGRLGLEVKALEEFGARNRPEGRVIWARLLVRFD